MKRISPVILLAFCLFKAALSQGFAAESLRLVQSFDLGWKFHRGDAPGAQESAYNDADWRNVDVPHDWSIEPMTAAEQTVYRAALLKAAPAPATPAKSGKKKKQTAPEIPSSAQSEGIFDPKSPATPSAGCLPGGIGWYRKTFTLPAETLERSIWIEFEGVYMNSDVWLNGHHLGNRPYGYSSFHYDLTPFLRSNAPNVLAVRANVEQPCSRWYSGAGIYRHVWLTTASPIHVAPWGTYITTPEITANRAVVRVRTTVQKDAAASETVTLRTTLLDPAEKTVASSETRQEISQGASQAFDQSLAVKSPALWSTESPRLYTAVTEVSVGDKLVDTVRTPFGIRSFEFTLDKGFFLNGKHVPIQGVCLHHDQGYLGAKAYDRAIERQLGIMKAMGCNAIRTSHNPPAPALLELCDRLGLLVMDEAFDEWKMAKQPFGYSRFFDEWSQRDLVAMLQRDRNHPSIIIWSIGNEIRDQTSVDAVPITKRLADICRREDPTRPVSCAMNRPGPKEQAGNVAPLDLFGINYWPESYDEYKGRYKLFGSETASATSTRGEYLLAWTNGQTEIRQIANNQVTAYERYARPNAQLAQDSLLKLKHSPWVAGEFVWTGFDYIGEPAPIKTWPAVSSYYGIVDLCGFPKDRFYLYQSQWSGKPMVHILPHWTWPGWEGRPIPVVCFTSGDSVELFLNGKSLGEKTMPATALQVGWQVPYQPGTLKAVAKKGGRVIATDEVHTAGPPAKLVLAVDRNTLQADGEDLAYLTVRVLDAHGTLCPDAANLIEFSVQGAGILAAVGNGNPISHEDFIGTKRTAFHGLCLGIVRATQQPGAIHVQVRSASLQEATVTLQAAGRH